MASFPRAELEEMVQRWLDANRRCEQAGDWRPLAAMYTAGATYGWNMGPSEEFMVAGRDQIRDVALALEMGGLDGWSYPYQRVLIDDVQGEVVGFWKQVAGAARPDGSHYEVAGIGGSWFRYGGGLAVGVAARLLRPRQRDGALPGDAQGRGAVGGHAAADGARGLRREAARALPPRRGPGAALVAPNRPQLL